MRRLPLAAAAAASAAVLASAAPALAAGHAHEHGHAHGHEHTAQAHSHTPKANDNHPHGASHVLANQLRQVNRMAEFASSSGKVNDADWDAVSGALQADVDALTAIQDGLADATTHRDAVAAIHHGILVRAVARTQVTVAVVANAVRDAAATATDSTVAGTATSAADDAVATVVALAPDATRAEINDIRHTALAELGDAGQATDDTGTDDSGADSGTTTPTP